MPYQWHQVPDETSIAGYVSSDLRTNTPRMQFKRYQTASFNFLCSPSHFAAYSIDLRAEENIRRQGASLLAFPSYQGHKL